MKRTKVALPAPATEPLEHGDSSKRARPDDLGLAHQTKKSKTKGEKTTVRPPRREPRSSTPGDKPIRPSRSSFGHMKKWLTEASETELDGLSRWLKRRKMPIEATPAEMKETMEDPTEAMPTPA